MKKLLFSLLLITAGSLTAQTRAAINNPEEITPRTMMRSQAVSHPKRALPVILAQADEAAYRINLLEEQLRKLNGRIEDLNFQILELQEQMRRRQEDNDYRFQELEERQGNAGGRKTITEIVTGDDEDSSLGKPEPSGQFEDTTNLGGNDLLQKNPRTIDGVEIYQGQSGVDDNLAGTLGTIQFDEDGNIVDTALGKPLDLTSKFSSGNEVQGPAAMPDSAEAQFSLGYDLIQSGRYDEAETVFTSFSKRYPDHPKIADANFWLGESYLGRGKFEAAAKTYLAAHKKWPQSRFGPHTLLKLGVAVAGLNQRELACATYAELFQKYPDLSEAVRRSVAIEQRAASCLTN